MKKLLTLGVFLTFLTGCATQNIADLSIIVPEKATITPYNLQHATVNKNVNGEDETSIFLIFPLGSPTLENAVNNTLKNGQGDVLTNAKITYKTRWFVLYGYKSIKVNADVVKLNRGGNFHE